MICIGDLVEVSDVSAELGDKMGLVIESVPVSVPVATDDVQLITIVHANGIETEWYDYNLSVISEAGWPGA